MSGRAKIADELGVTWLVHKDPEDPLYVWLHSFLKLYREEDCIIPAEVPRQGHCRIPNPLPVLELWRQEGDTPAFRRSLSAHLVRETMHSEWKSSSDMGTTADDARRIA